MAQVVKPYIVAIILAAGIGSRISTDKTKQKIEIAGVPILKRTIEQFDKCDAVDEIVIVYRPGEEDFARSCASNALHPVFFVPGSATRAKSARCGFSAVSEKSDIVMFHDAARCLITPDEIKSIAMSAYEHGAATSANYITDTVKLVEGGKIVSTVNRDSMLFVSTPQAFSYSLYKSALENDEDEESITDDNMRLEKIGVKITPVITSKENIKITTPEDIFYAEFILSRREKRQEG